MPDKPDKLSQLTPSIRAKVAACIADLEGKGFDAIIASALRDKAEQEQKVKQGFSKTSKSFHLPGPDGLSRAADVVPRNLGWDAPKRYWLMLGSAALAHGLGWGGLFNFTQAQRRKVVQAILGLRAAGWPEHHELYQVKISWDPAHLESVDNWPK